MCRAASLRQTPRCGLAEAVGAAMTQVRHVTLPAEPLTEIDRRERLAEFGNEERHLPRCALGDDRLQIRVHGNRQLDAGLELPNLQKSVADVLATHPHHVGSSLPGVEQWGERQARPRPDGVSGLELRDLVIAPAMEPIRLNADWFHVACRMVGAQADLDGVLYHGAKHLA